MFMRRLFLHDQEYIESVLQATADRQLLWVCSAPVSSKETRQTTSLLCP